MTDTGAAPPAQAPLRHPPLRPLRFTVIGLGAFGETYLACLAGLRAAAGVEVAAVCSRSAERARSLAQQYGAARWYTDPTEAARDAAADVVCVVTAEDEHRAPAVAALEAERHVLVEKPLATSLADADAILAAAERSRGQLLVGHLLRSSPLYASLAARVRAGDLGEIVSLHARRNRPAGLLERYRRTHPVLETGIHDLDILLWLAGSPVRRVRAYARTVNPGPTPDLVWGTLEFESGALGVLETHWLAPPEAGVYTDDGLSVVGSRGAARIDLTRAPLTVWTSRGYEQADVFYETRIDGVVGGALREQLLYFVGCLREAKPPDRVPHAEARHGLAVALALIRSAQEDRECLVAEEEARHGPGALP